MIDPHWFQKKWGTMRKDVPIEVLFEKIKVLENKVAKLEEENIETTNVLYELMENIRALDARIDIIAENPWEEQFN